MPCGTDVQTAARAMDPVTEREVRRIVAESTARSWTAFGMAARGLISLQRMQQEMQAASDEEYRALAHLTGYDPG
jgi:hypothetical protein